MGENAKRQLLAQSFEAATGRVPTSSELNSLLGGGEVKVESLPTLEARKSALEVSQQNMERFHKYAAIADELELSRDKFEQIQTEYDNNWALTTGNVASQYGLDQEIFAQAQYMLDGMNNTLFFDSTLTPEERANKLSANADLVAAKFFVNDAEKTAFKQASSLFARTIGNQQNAIARAFNVDADTFNTAQSQVQQSEDRFLGVWGSLLSGTAEPPEIMEDIQEINDPVVRQRYVDTVLNPIVQTLSTQGVIDSADFSRNDIDSMITALFSADNVDLLESLRNAYESAFPTHLFPDAELERTIRGNLEGWAAAEDKNTAQLYSFTTGIPRDWFNRIEDEGTKTAVLSLIGGTYGSTTERESSGLLGSLGSALGIAGGALIGGALSGGNPAAIAAGAQAGGQLGG